MKKILAFVFCFICYQSFSQVVIGDKNTTSAAVLHLVTGKYNTVKIGGFLMPVVTEAQQALIPVVSTDDGLMVFVSDTSTGKWCLEIYDGVQGVWRSIKCKTP